MECKTSEEEKSVLSAMVKKQFVTQLMTNMTKATKLALIQPTVRSNLFLFYDLYIATIISGSTEWS